MVHGQIEGWEAWPEGYATPNTALHVCDAELVPGTSQRDHRYRAHVARRLADADAGEHRHIKDPELKSRFERWWGTANMEALPRMKLYKLAWISWGPNSRTAPSLREFYAGIPSWCATRAIVKRRGRSSTQPSNAFWLASIRQPSREWTCQPAHREDAEIRSSILGGLYRQQLFLL